MEVIIQGNISGFLLQFFPVLLWAHRKILGLFVWFSFWWLVYLFLCFNSFVFVIFVRFWLWNVFFLPNDLKPFFCFYFSDFSFFLSVHCWEMYLRGLLTWCYTDLISFKFMNYISILQRKSRFTYVHGYMHTNKHTYMQMHTDKC